jgi:hypothetical protein
MAAPDILDLIVVDPETGLIPFLENTLGENWNRFYIKPWFPKSTIPRECGYRFREASSVVEGDRRVVTQMVALGRVFFMDDHTESMIQAMRLQNDMDQCVWHWSRFVCPHLLGSVEAFEGGGLGPEPNPAISSERPHAWSVFVIRYFAISYAGSTSIEFCCD